MKVGFYYHIETPFHGDGTAEVSSHLGLFIQEMARQLGHVTFFAHGRASTGVEDMHLGPPLVHCVDLGARRSFPARTFVPFEEMRMFRSAVRGLDAMLIRGPTPLLPAMIRAAGDLPVVVHLVGDYTHWEPRESDPRWRNIAIARYMKIYDWLQRVSTRNVLVLANNEELAEKMRKKLKRVEVAFTSSLPEADLSPSPRRWNGDVGRVRPARLMYAGRLVPEKGLWETTDAIALLKDHGLDATFDLVGWDDPRDRTIERLLEYAKQRGLGDSVRYLGYRMAGPELAQAYRDADIFVTASYWEGFPHTIFEAMGVGLPVVATTVGGIPAWLTSGDHALLIEPKSPQAIAGAVERLLVDEDLWNGVADRGWRWARDHTEERSCELVADRLRFWVEHVRASV